MLIGCGDDGGSSNTKKNGYLYYCETTVGYNGESYTAPTSCAGWNDKSHWESVSPNDGSGASIKMRGPCVCEGTLQAAKTACAASSLCGDIQNHVKQELESANPGTTVQSSSISCALSGNVAPAVDETNSNCQYEVNGGGENVTTARLALTSVSAADYEGSVGDLDVSLNVFKMILRTPDACVPGLGCADVPDITYEDTAHFTAQGTVAYSVVDRGATGCGTSGCAMSIDELSLKAPGQSRTFDPPEGDSATVSNVEVDSTRSITGTIMDNGTFTASGPAMVSFTVNGAPYTVEQNVDFSGTIDRATGAIVINHFSVTSGSEDDSSGRKTVTVSTIRSTPTVHPPVAVIQGPARVECASLDATPVTLSASGSTDVEGDISQYVWSLPDGTTQNAVQLTTELGYGTSNVALVVTDARLGAGNTSLAIDVVDTTPPELTNPGRSNYSLCDAGVEPVVLAPPTATDGCTGVSRIWGEATDAHGARTTFDSGSPVVLGLGNQVIDWYAEDAAGNVGHTQQVVTVAPAFTTFDRFDVRDRAQVAISSATGLRPGIVGNAGGSGVEIGANAQVGYVLSRSDVFLRSNSTVSYDIRTGGHVTRQAGATVGGTVTEGAVPALPSQITLFAPIPPSANGYQFAERGQVLQLVPGAYGNIIAHPGGVVRLATGRYSFESIILDSDSAWEVPAGAQVEIVIRGDLTHRGLFRVIGGGTASVHLLTYGNNVVLGPMATPTAWYGWTLEAPNASVTLSNNTYLAQLFAKRVEVAPGLVLACVASR